jgi:nitric oxide reductase subunit B
MSAVQSAHDGPLSPWWRQAAVLVMVVGFSILSFMTVQTYRNAPPIAETWKGPSGEVVFTQADVLKGQEVFLKYALMEHGTLWGHGAYLGPDYSAEYLHRLCEISQDTEASSRYGKPFAQLSPEEQGAVASVVKMSLKQNRYDEASKSLALTPGEVTSFQVQQKEWADYFTKKDGAPGLPAGYIKDPAETKALTAYFAWAAWACTALRPGHDYTYTNNFPYEPLAGNKPSTQAYVWSAVSLVCLLGGLGLILFIFGRFDYLGWGAAHTQLGSVPAPATDLRLTPGQWATGAYFAVVALLFLLQTFAGGGLAHYRVEPGAFYGLDISGVLPYTLLRTWHLQLAVFWIATAWVGGGLFLAPMVGGKEPKGQKLGVYALLGALAVVVFGSMFGEYLGINDRLGSLWFWFGHQGSEYLDLGRFWQLLLAVGLVFWLFLMFRALKPAFKIPGKSELASLFLYAAVAIPLFYVPALFYGRHTNFAIIDNWRFWIIHLWVEGFFELFATVLVAVMFHLLGLVSARNATRIVYLDAILYLAGGLAGTAHHWYFTGQPAVSMAIGACFSALEVVPLTLLTLDAWDFIKLSRGGTPGTGKSLAGGQKWAIYFLMAVGVWNFVGAGVFGFLINLPIVSYFQVGTTLTPNHGHAAMFGVFGMLALAVLVFCTRSMLTDSTWPRVEKFVKVGFWGLNVGLALMLLLDLFPAGLLQLWDSVTNGYWHCRRLTYTMTGTFHTLEWVRLGADMVFLLLGALPLTLGALYAFFIRDRARD